MNSRSYLGYRRRKLDFLIILPVLLLSIIGVVVIAAATYDPETVPDNANMLNVILSLRYSRLQAIWVLTGIALAAAVIAVPYRFYMRFLIPMTIGLILLLVALVVPKLLTGSGGGRGGVAAWINIGTNTLSPAEFAKVGFILVFSNLMTRIAPIKKLSGVFISLLYLAVPCVLIFLQGEFGSLLAFFAIYACILFLSGTDWKIILGMLLAAMLVAAIAYFAMMAAGDYRAERLLAFLNPEYDPQGASHQGTNAKLALGSGQIWGKGIFNSSNLSQLNYIPDQHTDMIFAVLGESLGFAGCIVTVLLYAILLFRLLSQSIKTHDLLGRMIIIGVMGMLMVHIFENIGMVVGLLPITGIPLPFISYGGSGTWANFIAIGLALNVIFHRETIDIRRRSAYK